MERETWKVVLTRGDKLKSAGESRIARWPMPTFFKSEIAAVNASQLLARAKAQVNQL
jgi:hypothetical protein